MMSRIRMTNTEIADLLEELAEDCSDGSCNCGGCGRTCGDNVPHTSPCSVPRALAAAKELRERCDGMGEDA